MKRFAAIIGVFCVLAMAGAAPACPLCKEGKTDAINASDVPAGFNLSIYAMLGGLFTVAGVGGWKLFQVVKQSDRHV